MLALVVSGGHTHLYLAKQGERGWSYQNIGHTRDDAAGEAFDKVAKVAGPGISRRTHDRQTLGSRRPDRRQLSAGAAQASRPQRPRPQEFDQPRFDFSYSGIKTAVLRYVEIHDLQHSIETRRQAMQTIAQSSASKTTCHTATRKRSIWWLRFSVPMVEDLVGKSLAAARTCNAASLFVTGGVAANQALRQRFEKDAAMEGLRVCFPSRPLSTDNAAMIAAAAYPKFVAQDFAPMDFSAEAGLALR